MTLVEWQVLVASHTRPPAGRPYPDTASDELDSSGVEGSRYRLHRSAVGPLFCSFFKIDDGSQAYSTVHAEIRLRPID